jgi:hypothetical protein
MGDILPTSAPHVGFRVDTLCSAALERIELFNGKELIHTFRPYGEEELGRRVRVLWEGAEYRGRGRETRWDGSAVIENNRAEEIRRINFWNPEKPLALENGNIIAWQSLTTGGYNGFDMVLHHPARGTVRVETPLIRFEIEIDRIGMNDTVMEAGGLGRRMRIFRLPDVLTQNAVVFDRDIALAPGRDNPLYAKVIQEDGHAAWSSPIYVVAG